MRHTGGRGTRGAFILLVFCMLAAVVLSVLLRTDASWDVQNYHLYGPFAVLHGGLKYDYFAAGFQGYLNPLADMPYYVTKFILFPGHPIIVAALSALPLGLLAFIVFQIAQILLPGAIVEAAIASLIGLTGATIVSEIGTVFDDILIADTLLLGLWAALAKPRNPAFAALPGLALGCAVGLKLTALLFTPGLLAVCLMQMDSRRSALVAAVSFCLASAVGFAAVYGWWGALLWERFHNPFFPIFPAVFRSPWSSGVMIPAPWATAINVRDSRFFPRSWMQWLFYPFFWLQGHRGVVSENRLRDPRFALVYLALAAGLLAAVTGRAARPSRAVAGVWAFFASSYFFWLIGFSILRYALALEALTGIVIWTAVRPLFRKPPAWALGLFCLAVIACTHPFVWGRIDYNDTLVRAPVPRLAPHSLVFLAGAPIGFVIPYLDNQGSSFVSLDWLENGSAEFPVVARLVKGTTAIRLLTNVPASSADSTEINARLARFGLAYSETTCLPVRSPLQVTIRLCDVESHP